METAFHRREAVSARLQGYLTRQSHRRIAESSGDVAATTARPLETNAGPDVSLRAAWLARLLDARVARVYSACVYR